MPTESKSPAPTKPLTPPTSSKVPVPQAPPKPSALAWTIPFIDKAEESVTHYPPEALLRYAVPEIERFGILSPTKAIGDDLMGFAAKLRAAMLTAGNTKFRAPLRTFLTHLMQFGPYQLDTTLLIRASVKWALSDAFTAVASAAVNKIESQSV